MKDEKSRALVTKEMQKILYHLDHNFQLQIPEKRIEDEERIIITRYSPIGQAVYRHVIEEPMLLSTSEQSILHQNGGQ